MTLYSLIVYAFLTSTAASNSDRMAAQLAAPTLELVSAGAASAPLCVNVYCVPEDAQ